MQLTKDADKTICLIYKEFLSRRNSGMSKSDAKDFDCDDIIKLFTGFNLNDIYDNLVELKKNHLIELFLSGEFILSTDGIVYMENRFKNGLNEVVDFITKFIP